MNLTIQDVLLKYDHSTLLVTAIAASGDWWIGVHYENIEGGAKDKVYFFSPSADDYKGFIGGQMDLLDVINRQPGNSFHIAECLGAVGEDVSCEDFEGAPASGMLPLPGLYHIV